MNNISVSIITKNEAEKLAHCLRSVAWVDHVVVVDDYSDDDTQRLCERTENVTYYTRKFDGFGFQKAYALSLVESEWVLSLDTDEEVTDALKDEILAVIQSDECNGYYVRRANVTFGKISVDSFPGTLRLFRRTYGAFSQDFVHERVEVNGAVGQLNSLLEHRSTAFESFSNYYARYVIKYADFAAKDYYQQGRRVSWRNAVIKLFVIPIAVFLRDYLKKRKFTQGKAGLFISVCNGLTYYQAYRQLWRMQQTPSSDEG